MRLLMLMAIVGGFLLGAVGCGTKYTPPTPVPVPGNDLLVPLAKETLKLYVDALEKGDFTDYYNSMSKEYTSFTSLTTFANAKKKELEAGFDLSEIATADPVITSAGIDRKPSEQRTQIIVFEGRFDISPSPVSFKLRYVDEDGRWKLFTHFIKVEQ
mgnify:CR=1 FL=1